MTTNQGVKFMKKLHKSYHIDHETLNGSKNPKLRTEFQQDPKCKLLVATDVAARGLDFPNVDWYICHEEILQQSSPH
jgi:superfamily II DNA/RNA helicase